MVYKMIYKIIRKTYGTGMFSKPCRIEEIDEYSNRIAAYSAVYRYQVMKQSNENYYIEEVED